MSLTDKQWRFLQDVAYLIFYAKSIGMKLTGGELYRTEYQQEKYVKDGLSKTMNSKHRSKLAIDLFLIIDNRIGTKEEYKPLGDYWKQLRPENEWGGDWGWDANHFQTS